MDIDDILEEKKEETTENEGGQNELTDSPSGLETLAQQPVESDDGQGDLGDREEEADPGMGDVIQNMLAEPKKEEADPGMGDAIQNMLAEPQNAVPDQEVQELQERPPVEKEPAREIKKESKTNQILKEKEVLKIEQETPKAAEVIKDLENRNEDSGTIDEVSDDLLDLAIESGGGPDGGGDQNGAFDTLGELKRLKDTPLEENVQNNTENNNNNQNDVVELIKKISEARRGNVYAAVVLAKGLKNNESNPFTSAGYKRRTRFMNNSKLNKALEINKMESLAQGMLSSVVPGAGKSKFLNAVTIVSNLLAVVGSVRDLMKKIRMYKSLPKTNTPGMEGQKKSMMRTKAFTVLGMVSDGVMLLNKLCGIAKAVSNMCKSDNLTAKAVSKISGYVSLALGGATQLMGIASSVNQMLKVKEEIQVTEKAKEDKETAVDEIWDRYLPGTRAGSEAAKERLEAKKEAAKNENGKPEKEEDPDSDENLYTANRAYIAVRLLERGDVSEDDKDVLSEYLRMERKIGKLDDQFRDGIYGLVTLSTGLMATITGSVSAAYDTSGVAKPTAQQEHAASVSSKVNAAVGITSSGIALVNTGRGFTKGWNKESDGQGDVLKERARGVVEELQDNKYGLRGIAASFLTNPTAENENVEKANNALNKYADADKRLKSLGVKYPQLMKASNVKEFDAALIAEI